MAERRRIDDLSELIQTAVRAITKAMGDGEATHPPGFWQTYDEQIDHLREHLRLLAAADDGEDHLAHLICRAVIARALREPQ